MEYLISRKLDISKEVGEVRSGSKEAKGSASWVTLKENKKIELLVPLSLSLSCPSLGDRSLPSFTDVGSCYIVEVAGKEVKDLRG